MGRFFRFVLIVMVLFVVAMLSAITTMSFAIHGAEVKVPGLKGLTVAEAVRKCSALDLHLSVDSRFYSPDMAAGRLVSQSPVPGTMVRREWRVRVIESLGPQRVAIPNLVGQQERVASIEIRRLGLELGSVADMPYAAAQPGTIIAQNPMPNASGVERPSVSLLIAAPAAATPVGMLMPDLTGQMLPAATAAIAHAGLKLAPVQSAPLSIPGVDSANSNQPIRPPIPPGAVVSQSPPAGYRVDANTPIALTVAQ